MKRLLVAVFLFASVKLVAAAETTHLVVNEDIHQKIHAMIANKQLRKGMNLVATTPTGERIWADVKREGQSVVMTFVITDRSDKKLPTSEFAISFGGNVSSEEKWYVCTTTTSGQLHCTEVPCVPKFPYPHLLLK